MTLVSDPEPDVAPVAIAGLLLAARTWLADLRLAHPTVAEILAATGATRSRAYEVRDEILDLLPDLVRPPGRPRVERGPPTDDRAGAITREILRFVMDHPGCVHGGRERRRYGDALRRRVLELREEHHQLDLAAFAEATGVPAATIECWLRLGGEAEPTGEPAAAARPADDTESDVRIAVVETVLHAWRGWHGDFTGFCHHVRRHLRIKLGDTLISEILFAHGERTPARRGRRHSDEDALRGTFETYFPGAQWVGDGAEVAVGLDGQRFGYNLELIVDAASGAFVGTSVRDAEDSEAVVEAFAAGVETAGEAPIALLLDNRPSNHTPDVDTALGDTLRIRATPGRPQNKAHVEGGFGLFAQHTPSIELRTDDRRELGRQIIGLVATLFARILNHCPRRDRGGQSRHDIYTATPVAEEQRERARQSLLERLRIQERARRTREARLDPRVKQILDDAFARLDLLDPERHFRNAIACYPIDDIVDGIATFEAKRNRSSLPDGVDARYLLGIVRNLHHVHEADAITQELIRARLDARDAMLQPLVRQRDATLRSTGNSDSALRSFVDQALAADRAIDRTFWLQAAADLIVSCPDADRRDLVRAAARRIHANFAIPTRHRFAATNRLARLVWPLS